MHADPSPTPAATLLDPRHGYQFKIRDDIGSGELKARA
jgi:hypothetical protein